MSSQSLPPLKSPQGADGVVSLTIDVDGDPAAPGVLGPGHEDHLSSLSYLRYGPTRGLPRILEMLCARSIRATFYVPGATALAYPDSVRRIVAEGHELAHHGHLHLASTTLTRQEQVDEIDRGLEALDRVAGIRPVGYRSPMGELTPSTLSCLVNRGFRYDSSCMGDDRPYVLHHGSDSILELPFEWHLDDAPYYYAAGGQTRLFPDPRDLMRRWWDEFESARSRRVPLTLIIHPEFSGRGFRLDALASLLDRMCSDASPRFASHGELAEAATEP